MDPGIFCQLGVDPAFFVKSGSGSCYGSNFKSTKVLDPDPWKSDPKPGFLVLDPDTQHFLVRQLFLIHEIYMDGTHKLFIQEGQ